MASAPEKYVKVLKKYFGYNEFRQMQWKIINSVLEERRDNCVIMATGYGKSLCYQYPPVFANGIGIVISPLISLMQDQVLALQVKNIPATLMGTAQKDKHATIEDIKKGKYRLVYVTPEWCSTDGAIDLLKDLATSTTVKLTLVAIDEAHCVSQWGMDFRKSYRRLGELKTHLCKVPFLALTATATPTVQRDICDSLNLSRPLVTCTSFDRPNLFLSCSVKGSSILTDIKSVLFTENSVLNGMEKGSCIIYCPTKKKVDEVATWLNNDGIKCEMYHADLSLSVRERVHKDFVRDKLQVVVATVAFGMGIDKPDVRRIIHYGAPYDIETYYQEMGRAGRDGEQAHCHVFYQQSDFGLAKHFLSTVNPMYRNYKESMARIMERYLQTSDCRRKIIISHFDPAGSVEENPICCDNCLKNKGKSPNADSAGSDDVYDLSDDAVLLLRAVRDTRGVYGLQVPIFLLRGSTNKKLPSKYHTTDLFGKGYDKAEEYWKLLGGLLLREFLLEDKFVKTNGSFGSFPIKTVQISRTGHDFINNPNYRGGFKLKPTPEMMPHVVRLNRSKAIRPGTWLSNLGGADSVDNAGGPRQKLTLEEVVFEALLKFRTKVAADLDCMPYMIMDNHTIHLLALNPPSTIEQLQKIDGITVAKAEKFGSECLSCIAAARKNLEVLLERGNQMPNVKQFNKKKVIKYDSDENSDDDSGKLGTTSTDLASSAEIPEGSSLKPDPNDVSVSDRLLEDSFCDDDIFECLANDEELISSSLSQQTSAPGETVSGSSPPAKRLRNWESQAEVSKNIPKVLTASASSMISKEFVKKNEIKKAALFKKIKL